MADFPDSTTYDESDTCWHIMTVSRGGKVSLLRNLDAPTARQAYQRLRPDEEPKEYMGLPDPGDPDFRGGFSWGYGFQTCQDSDIEKVEVLGPDGAELEPWRGVEPRIIDLTREVGAQRAMRRAHRERAA